MTQLPKRGNSGKQRLKTPNPGHMMRLGVSLLPPTQYLVISRWKRQGNFVPKLKMQLHSHCFAIKSFVLCALWIFKNLWWRTETVYVQTDSRNFNCNLHASQKLILLNTDFNDLTYFILNCWKIWFPGVFWSMFKQRSETSACVRNLPGSPKQVNSSEREKRWLNTQNPGLKKQAFLRWLRRMGMLSLWPL